MVQVRTDDVVWQSIEGEIVILDNRASRYLSLKGSGAVLWPHLVGGASTDDLAGALVETYGIERDRAERDVDAFIASLRERGLLSA